MNDPFVRNDDTPINPENPEDLKRVLDGLKRWSITSQISTT